jgi:hypothetical protein
MLEEAANGALFANIAITMARVVVAFGIAMLFPINYLANENNQRFDFGFFKSCFDSCGVVLDTEKRPSPFHRL